MTKQTIPDLDDNIQRDRETGEPVGIAPVGEKSEGEIKDDRKVPKDEALKIDPESRIPRPPQPDLA